jgi:hypothetical protein
MWCRKYPSRGSNLGRRFPLWLRHWADLGNAHILGLRSSPFDWKAQEANDQRNRFATGEPAAPGEPNQFVPIIESLLVSLMSIGTLIGALSGA